MKSVEVEFAKETLAWCCSPPNMIEIEITTVFSLYFFEALLTVKHIAHEVIIKERGKFRFPLR